MKREIKFRAWTRTGEWDDTGERRQFEMIDGDSLCPMECEPFKDILADIEDEYYIMQFTGLKDKNGRDLYESDIVRWQDDSMEPITEDIDTPHNVVSMNPSYDGMGFILYLTWNEFEVIGNIYENPELIKQS